MRHPRHGIQTYLFISLVFVLASSSCVFGQLKVFSLPAPDGTNPPSVARPLSHGRLQAEPKALPFFDDFSGTPTHDGTAASNYPVDSLWQYQKDKRTVWINDGLAINAPSLNVATFDGLDSLFLPYESQALANGLRDNLVSVPILLGESSVSAAQRPTVYMSFAYQWQGNGEAPDATDYLAVEFKNASGQWNQVMAITARASFSRTVFYDTVFQVTGEEYFHDDFQFRFRNYGRLSGPYDTWNVDYVYLNKNRNPDDRDFPDQAVSSSLSSLFGKYRSIPYEHFLTTNVIERPGFMVSNNLNEYTDLTYLAEGTFRSYLKGSLIKQTYLSNLGGTDTSAINDDGSGIIFPLEKRTVHLEYVPDASDPEQFSPDADSVWLKLKVRLFTGDTFDPKTGAIAHDYDFNYLPIDFRVNDTIATTYNLGKTYAYDDGVAEYSAGLTQAGNRAAVAFDMVYPDADTLTGIDVYVPDYGLASNLTVDFTVYTDDNGVPGTPVYTIPSYSVQRRGANVFQRIPILEAFLVEQRFYIGWKAPVGGVLKVGLDYNSFSGDQIFVNTNGTWTASNDIAGSLMIRPVLGKGNVVTSAETPVDAGVYPNPSSGTFYVTDTFDEVAIFNLTGQPVTFEVMQEEQARRIKLLQPSPGVYVVHMTTGNKQRAVKVVVK